MEKHTSKTLGWFFDNMLTTTRKMDFTITKARVKDGNTIATVTNRSGVEAPLHIAAYKGDSITASAWTAPFAHKATVSLSTTYWNRLRVEPEIADPKSSNDVYRRSALLHHFAIKVKPFAGINRSEKDKLFISPALGLNRYDGVMAGILFHNVTIPENRFVFAVAPLFSFRNESFTGAGAIGYSWYPHSVFKEIMLMADAKTFHHDETRVNLTKTLYARYIKVAPSLQFILKERDPQSPVIRTLCLKEYNINEDVINYGGDSLAKPVLNNIQNMYAGMRYVHNNKRTFNPFSYSIDGHGNADFAKLNVEGNIRIDYYAPGKSLYVRGYLGKFFAINNNPAVTNRYLLNASYSGVDDYLYDGTYRGRNVSDGFSGQQVSTLQEGGFKVPVSNGAYRTDNWMAAVNLKTDLPMIKLPIRVFVDAGLIPNPSPGFKNVKSTLLLYDAGLEVYLSKDIVSFYFPLIMSSDFHDYLAGTFGNKNVFARSISFTLHLQNINWLRMPSRLLTSLAN